MSNQYYDYDLDMYICKEHNHKAKTSCIKCNLEVQKKMNNQSLEQRLEELEERIERLSNSIMDILRRLGAKGL